MKLNRLCFLKHYTFSKMNISWLTKIHKIYVPQQLLLIQLSTLHLTKLLLHRNGYMGHNNTYVFDVILYIRRCTVDLNYIVSFTARYLGNSHTSIALPLKTGLDVVPSLRHLPSRPRMHVSGYSFAKNQLKGLRNCHL